MLGRATIEVGAGFLIGIALRVDQSKRSFPINSFSPPVRSNKRNSHFLNDLRRSFSGS
jgi:hypothetical protein